MQIQLYLRGNFLHSIIFLTSSKAFFDDFKLEVIGLFLLYLYYKIILL